MTKHDWFWVLVKFAGLAFLAYSVIALVMMLTLSDGRFGNVLLRLLINVGAIGAIGIWLIRDGRLLTNWARASDREPARKR